MKLSHITSYFFMLTAGCMLGHAEVRTDSTNAKNHHTHPHAEGEHEEHGDHAHPHAEGEHEEHGDHAHPHAEGEHEEHGDHAHPHAEDEHGDHAHPHAEGEHEEHGDHAHPHAEGEHGDHAHPHAEGEHEEHGDHAHPHAEGEHEEHGDHAHPHAEGEHEEHGDHAHPHAEGEHEEHDAHAHPHAEGEHEEHGDHAHPHGDHGHDHGNPQPIIVTADARARDLVNMRIETVPQTTNVLVHSVYGYLGSPDHALQTYALPCSGRITLHVKSAQNVKEGDLLYSLQSPAITDLQADVIRNKAAIRRCESEIETQDSRVRELIAAGTRNKDLEVELANKKAELEQLRQEHTALQTRLSMLALGGNIVKQGHLDVLEIRAAANGTVRNVGITQGSWGEQGAPVISMSHEQSMEISAALYGSNVPVFSEIRATIPVGREHISIGGSWRLSNETDRTTRTRELYFTPDSIPAGVQSGQLCRLDLYTSGNSNGMVSIPDTAVVKVGVDDVVFVEVAEGQFAMVKVHAGTSRRGMTPVAGLTPGQRIVVLGGYELKYQIPGDGQQKKAGHFHADGKFHEGDE